MSRRTGTPGRRFDHTDSFLGYGVVTIVSALLVLLNGLGTVLGCTFLVMAAGWFLAWHLTRHRRSSKPGDQPDQSQP